MLWLYIILGILLFIMMILLIPIRVCAKYNDTFTCSLVIGFIKLQIYPEKAKKPKKKKTQNKNKERKEPKPKEQKQNLIQEKGLDWFVDMLKKVANLANNVLKDFFKHIIIKRMLISITIAGNDAADTAIKYGQLCSVVYPAVGIIAKNTKCKKYGVDISPNFDENANSEYSLDFKASTLVLWLVVLIVKYGFKGIKLLMELREGE